MSQQRPSRSAVWKFFTKTGDDYKAICPVCKKHLSYKGTTTNLITHLRLKHTDEYIAFINGDFSVEIESGNAVREEQKLIIKKRKIWKYFKFSSTDAKKLQCNICSKVFNASENIYHLKKHLERQHHSKYLELYGEQKNKESADDSDDEASESSIKFSSEIWGYFEQVDEGSRCTICEKTTENSVEEMRNHLEEDHPGILISILNNKEETDAEETFTEVVYLEEEKRTPKAKRRKTLPQPTCPTSPVKATPTCAPTESRPDIDTFLNYLGVLLRNVPKESMPKLQLDVVSCVLNAQIPQNEKNCNCKEASAASHTQYQILIDSDKIVTTNIPTAQ